MTRWLVVVGVLGLVGCSSEDVIPSETTTGVTVCDPTAVVQTDDDLPAVSLVPDALDALEAELGSDVEFFEINATARLVNMFVALNDGTIVRPYLWVDGELTSQDGRPASGGTFRAESLDYDADTVLDTVRAELPESILETFYVLGDGNGGVRYGVLTTAVCGGGLDVEVGSDGTVVGVTPVE